MRTIGNILWLVLAGFWLAVGYAIAGIILCVLIVTIPFGVQSLSGCRGRSRSADGHSQSMQTAELPSNTESALRVPQAVQTRPTGAGVA